MSIEYIPRKLEFVSGFVQRPNVDQWAIDVQEEFPYRAFDLDHGPLNLGQVFAFTAVLNAKLEALAQVQVQRPDARVRVLASTAPQYQANAACILSSWAIVHLGWNADQAYAPFQHLAFPSFHDASRLSDSFGLSVFHVLRGLERASQCRLLEFEKFDTADYFARSREENGDVSRISTKFLAFASPREASGNSRTHVRPEVLMPYFQQHNVTLVVRLSKRRYDPRPFLQAGIAFLDLFFPDGSCPSDSIVQKFLSACEQASGAVAVHCKAGLGRTGTLIACCLMKHHHFTAEEAIGWLRMCRPGSVVGPQQHFLRSRQQQLWNICTSKEADHHLGAHAISSDDVTIRIDSKVAPTILANSAKQHVIPVSSLPLSKGIASRRHRSSLASGAIMVKMDQFRNGSFAGAKKSHTVTPIPGRSLPPRIPGKIVHSVKSCTLHSPLQMRNTLFTTAQASDRWPDLPVAPSV